MRFSAAGLEVVLGGKTVVVLSVKEYPVKPIAVQGRYFRRVGNSNHQLTASEVSDLYLQTIQLSWDAYQCPGAKLKDLDLKKAKVFIHKVNERGRLRLEGSTQQCLAKLGFIKDDNPTNAAMIFFAKKPLSYDVHVGRLKTPSQYWMTE